MRRGIRKPCGLKARRYITCLIDLNKYLDLFPGGKLSDKIGVMDQNEIFLYCMPNIWINKDYVQGFDGKSINLKKAVNIFERMKIAESIYEDVVEPSYEQSTRSDGTYAGHIRQNIV